MKYSSQIRLAVCLSSRILMATATQEADIVRQVSDNNASPAGQRGMSGARGLRHQQQTLEEEEEEDTCLLLLLTTSTVYPSCIEIK